MYISQGQCPDIRYLVQAGLIHMVCVSVCSSERGHPAIMCVKDGVPISSEGWPDPCCGLIHVVCVCVLH